MIDKHYDRQKYRQGISNKLSYVRKNVRIINICPNLFVRPLTTHVQFPVLLVKEKLIHEYKFSHS
ncbi:MAG: hypothetical protein US28_C0005G0061 [Candidatus Daviesbacteria bacterium GW2011_GWA1_36_8]|uniref:Uncharacterized protein n=1 Tax=Candidatus Daviesbacteria bacterium GW2011_GWA1_36_8 TaxID=1618417 RepID=A0A0G0IJF4_9BACT|nr:MAG: hypothetical protein US28_C0005G0061 [Candidatus Daviesbacteria bacterium GW2011_GWA1_36_8]